MAPGLISLRGDGPWRGRSTRCLSDRGGRYQKRIVNGYVSGDGNEIRSFGWRTLLDLTAVNNADNGFRRYVFDAAYPVMTSESPYIYEFLGTTSPDARLTLKCRADEVHIHAFEQVHDVVTLIGEAMHREIPIYTTARVKITVTGVSLTAGLDWRIEMSGDASTGRSDGDNGTGMHGLTNGDIVYIDEIEITDTSSPEITQAMADAYLSGRFHPVKSRSGGFIILKTSMPGAIASGGVTTATGEIHRTRGNASDVYSTPNPPSPWEPSIYHRIDDPMCLTTWTVREALSLSDPASRKCMPAWVANRQRDFGDAGSAGFSPLWDGVRMPGTSPDVYRGWSRRRQRPLPYRVNPEVAGDRIVIAAPSYLCCFQIPAMLPIEPEDWPSPPASWSPAGGSGMLWFANDLYDKPRCLGVPKGMVIDSLAKNPISPGSGGTPGTVPYDFQTYSSPTTAAAWSGGAYRIAISYVDDVTGEEGLASDPIDVTITNGLGIQLYVMHPGYMMPECLCRRINVYVAPPGTEAMGFYTSLPLRHGQPGSTGNAFSAKYGVTTQVSASPDAANLWHNVWLPFLGSPLTNAIDFSRLAPQSGQMPRGAETAKFIGGILLTVGHSGTHGNVGEVLRSTMSADFSRNTLAFGCLSPDEVQVRAFKSDLVEQSTPASSTPAMDGGFMVAGNLFPSAYEGLPIFTRDLLTAPHNRFQIDVLKNFRTVNDFSGGFGSPGARDLSMTQRLRTVHDIRDRTNAPDVLRKQKEVFVLLPRGQIQVGDPGRTGAVSSTNIQFMDGRRDDDGIAIGDSNGTAVICSKKETYALAWHRTPQGNVPKLVTPEHGCIATNSMVQFDGGCAWIGARGPVAMTGNGFAWVGEQIEDDFHDDELRYRTDSKGLSRCTWGAHDGSRGLVMWGLITSTATHQMEYKGVSATYANSSDEARSRFPCDEVLIWSYRANAFSTWRPPSGLEVLWMRELKLGDGSKRMCFLAADKRIYALGDEWSDTNEAAFVAGALNSGEDSVDLVIAQDFGTDTVGGNGGGSRGDSTLLRVGMSVVQYDADHNVIHETTVAALDVDDQSVTLTDAATWAVGDVFEIGLRPKLVFETTYIGENTDGMNVQAIHLRYGTIGPGKAHADVTAKITNLNDTAPTDAGMVEHDTAAVHYQQLVVGELNSTEFDRIGQRRTFEQGRPDGAEVSFTVSVLGSAGVRITDVLVQAEA
jgi:hypothetical protein